MKLKEWRWLIGYEQSKLAKKLGVSQPEISRIETGGYRSMKARTRFKELFGKEVYKIDEFKFSKFVTEAV